MKPALSQSGATSARSFESSFPEIETTGFPASLAAERRQDAEDGADLTGDDSAGATYNDGMWTPPAATVTAIATPTALLLTPSPTTPISLSTILLSSTSSPAQSSVISTSSGSSSRSGGTISSSSTALGSSSSTASMASVTVSASALPTSSSNKSGGGGFKLIYLTPLFVLVGLILLFSIGGRIWGRIHHASRVEAARRARYDKRASKIAKKAEMRRIKTMWGYAHTPMLPAESDDIDEDGNDIHYRDPRNTKSIQQQQNNPKSDREEEGDSSIGTASDDEPDEKYPGTFKILSLALLGEGSRPTPPQTRQRTGTKYETSMQSNSWLAVQLRRWIGRDEKEGYNNLDQKYTAGPIRNTTRRLRHALSREKFGRFGANNGSDDTLHSDTDEKAWAVKQDLTSPATTLSVGSDQPDKNKEFTTIHIDEMDTRQEHPTSFGAQVTGFIHPAFAQRKPLPITPKDSPFRSPGFANFGLRSRSKTYYPVSINDGAAKTFKDIKSPFPAQTQTQADDLLGTPSKSHPRSFGLGISGIWRAVTSFGLGGGGGGKHDRLNLEDEDEESFVGRPYQPHSDVMSDHDTPYAKSLTIPYVSETPTKPQHAAAAYRAQYLQGYTPHEQGSSPTRGKALHRTGTVLNVKPNVHQPWNSRSELESPPTKKTMSAAAWNSALLASPVKRQNLGSFQPLTFAYSQDDTNGNHGLHSNNPELKQGKSISKPNAIESHSSNYVLSPVGTDFSDLVACYSTPSARMTDEDAEESDQDEADWEQSAGVRAIPSTDASLNPISGERDVPGRSKLQRARTTKLAREGSRTASHETKSIARSKTSSTGSYSMTSTNDNSKGLGRKPTRFQHASRHLADPLVEDSDTRQEAMAPLRNIGSSDDYLTLHGYQATRPLKVATKDHIRNNLDSPRPPMRTSSSPRKTTKEDSPGNVRLRNGVPPSNPASLSSASRKGGPSQADFESSRFSSNDRYPAMPSSLMIASPQTPGRRYRHQHQLSFDASAAYTNLPSLMGAERVKGGMSSFSALSSLSNSNPPVAAGLGVDPSSPPKRSNAVVIGTRQQHESTNFRHSDTNSNATTPTDLNGGGIVFEGARYKASPAQKAHNRTTAFQTVNDILTKSYANTNSHAFT